MSKFKTILLYITITLIIGVPVYKVMADIGGSGISGSTTYDGTGVNITATTANITTLTAASSNTTGVMAANVLNVSGATTIGTEAAGANVTVNATLGSELSPALTGATGVNWTFAGTYTTPLNNTIEKAGAGTDTITPVTQSITAGTTYKVVITFSAFTAGSASYTLGGVTGSALSAATTYTDYITASTTGKLIITPVDAARFVVSAVSVKALTDATGDITAMGDIKATSQFIAHKNNITYPAYSFMNYNMYGYGLDQTQTLALYHNGNKLFLVNDQYVSTNSASQYFGVYDTKLYRDATNILALRSSTSQNTFRVYNTYTNTSNYERFTLTGTAGASVDIKAETAGTGGDNLDVTLTPVGTGLVKIKEDLANVSTTTGSAGGFARRIAEATSGTLSGATGTIAVNVPTGARILGVQLRVDTAVTFSGTDTTWKAVYVNTPTTAICSTQAAAKSTKYSALHAAYEITTGTVTITVSSDGSDTFTGGVIRGIVYYEDTIAMSDAP
jgi:hypothetical protein